MWRCTQEFVGPIGQMEIAGPMKHSNKFLPHYGPTGTLRPPCRQKFATEAGNNVEVYTGIRGTDRTMEIAGPMKHSNKFLPHSGPTGSLRPPCRHKFETETGNNVEVYTGEWEIVYTGTQQAPQSPGGLPDGGGKPGNNATSGRPPSGFASSSQIN